MPKKFCIKCGIHHEQPIGSLCIGPILGEVGDRTRRSTTSTTGRPTTTTSGAGGHTATQPQLQDSTADSTGGFSDSTMSSKDIGEI